MPQVPDPAPSILLVDDHAVIAAPLVLALRSAGFARVAAVDIGDLTPEGILDAARSHRPDIVLLDLHLGGDRLGLPVIGSLVEMGANVVLFTASHESSLLALGLRSGASGVIDKAMPFHHLVAVLLDAASGRPLMPDDERQALIDALDRQRIEHEERHRPFERLTEREADVLRRLLDGESPKRIARDEGISVSTVRGHIRGVLSKLGVNSQREAFALARALNWPGPR